MPLFRPLQKYLQETKIRKPIVDLQARNIQSELARKRQIEQIRSDVRNTRTVRPAGLKVSKGQIAGRVLGQRVAEEIARKNPTVLDAIRRATRRVTTGAGKYITTLSIPILMSLLGAKALAQVPEARDAFSAEVERVEKEYRTKIELKNEI